MANNQLKEEIILSTQHFDKKIDDVIKRMNKLQSQGGKVGSGFNDSMSKMITKAIGFDGSLKSVVGVVGKFSGALGLAMGAGEAFNKTIHSSQTLTDEYGRIQQSVTTVVDDFFQSLANGDFSPFLNGIDNIVTKAQEAFNAMDDLFNMSQSFSVQNARLNNQFQKNLNEIRRLKGSKNANDQKKVESLTADNKRIIEQQTKGGLKLYNQTISALQYEIAAGTGMNNKITEGAIYRIVENDINNLKDGRKKYAKEYNEYLKKAKEIQNKYSGKKVGGGLIAKVATSLNPNANLGADYQREMNKLQNKYGESIAANYLLQKKSDEELQEFNNKLKQGIAYQGTAISNQSKMLRYTKETNEASGGKKGGGANKGGNNKKGIDYAINSVGYLENKISELTQEIKLQVDSDSIRDLQKEIVKYKYLLSELMQPTKKLDLNKVNLKPNFASALNIQNELQAFLNRKPLEIKVDTNAKASLGDIAGLIDDISYSFTSLGDSLEMPALNVAGIIAQAVASVISGYAQASAQSAKLGPWAWVGFSLAGLAQVANIVSQIHSLSGYANGGVIGGSSYGGDRLLARVNSGEAIVTQNQQKHLFELLNNGNTNNGVTNGNVHFVIRGSELHGVLANYNNRNNKLR